MTAEKIAEIETKIKRAGEAILNHQRSCEEAITAGVNMTNVIADLKHDITKTLSVICLKPENSGKPDNFIQTQFKINTLEETRLLSIAKGYKSSLNRIEYEMYK